MAGWQRVKDTQAGPEQRLHDERVIRETIWCLSLDLVFNHMDSYMNLGREKAMSKKDPGILPWLGILLTE